MANQRWSTKWRSNFDEHRSFLQLLSAHLLLRVNYKKLCVIPLIFGLFVGDFVWSPASAATAQPTITNGPTGLVASRSATFTYTSPVNATFRCSLDSGPLVNCPNGAPRTTGSTTFSGLADGVHTFAVTATVGTVTSSATTRTWTIDATRPAVQTIALAEISPHAFGSVSWLVTFSEPVKNVGLSNFSLTNVGLNAGFGLTSISPANSSTVASTTFTVVASTGPVANRATTTIRLNLSTTTPIIDSATNTLNGTLAGATYVLDGFGPLVSVNQVNGATVTFPFATLTNVTSIGGICGTVTGDAPLVSVAITGTTSRVDTVGCTAGVWVLPVALSRGTYGITATQSDSFANIGSSGAKALTVNAPDRTPPVVAVTMINGSTTVDGAPLVFPLITNSGVSSVGGTCGTAAGDLPGVTVSVTGPTVRNGNVTCSGGNWTFVLSPPLLNSGANDGVYSVVATQRDTGANIGSTGAKSVTIATVPFTISGTLVGTFSPGSTNALAVVVTNPHPFAIAVQSMTVAVSGTASCSAANFAVVTGFRGQVTVQPGSLALPTANRPVLRMLDLATNQDGCKSAALTLTFTGTATRA
jgi:hypothetical protein